MVQKGAPMFGCVSDVHLLLKAGWTIMVRATPSRATLV